MTLLYLLVTPPCLSPLLTPHWEPAHWFGLMTHPAGDWLRDLLSGCVDWTWLPLANMVSSIETYLEPTWKIVLMCLLYYRVLFIQGQWCRLTWRKQCSVHILCIFHFIRLNLRWHFCFSSNKCLWIDTSLIFFFFFFVVPWRFTSGGHSCSALCLLLLFTKKEDEREMKQGEKRLLLTCCYF